MSWFNNQRILLKLMMLVALMSAISIFLAGVGIHSLATLDSKANHMEESAQEALEAGNLRLSLSNIDELKFHIVADPSTKSLEESYKSIEEQKTLFNNSIATLEKTADDSQHEKLEKIKANLAAYILALDETIKTASSIKDFSLSEDQAKIKAAAHSSDDESDALDKVVSEFSDDSKKNVSALSDEITTLYEQISKLMMVVAAVGTLAGLGIGFALARFGIANPITAIVALLQKLAEGILDIDISGTDRKDEVGDIAKTARIFKDNALERRRMEAQEKVEVQRKLDRQERVDKLVSDFDIASSAAVNTVASAATELSQTAADMSRVATQTNQQAVEVAAASNQTSGTVQTVAAAAEEMSSSVKEISSQVSKSNSNIREALEETKSANAISMQMLEAARSITSVTELIENIAAQINLLALNATIESARAGDAGKGFAVVASEVKSLAGQTTKATVDIRQQLDNLGQMAENVAAALVKLSISVEKVNETSGSIAAAVEEQTAVTQEIATNMNTTASAVDQINNNIGGIQKSTETTSAATQQILSASGMLSQQAEDLNMQVRAFLDSIKAA